MPRPHAIAITSLLLLAGLTRLASAQSPSPAPAPNPQTWIIGWHQLERIPPHAERNCTDDAVLLYAPGDKRNSLLAVSACADKKGNWSYWNHRGTVDGSGRFKIITLWPFRSRYRVVATAPDYTWAIIGSADHRSLWILAQSATLPPDILAQLEATAAANGFNIAKLVKVPTIP